MKENSLIYIVIGIIIGGFLVWLGTTIINSRNYSMMNMMGVRSNNLAKPTVNSNSIDAHFIEQMIPHHEDAITMSKIALEKTTREELKNLAQNIISAQSLEIQKIKEWYNEWFGSDVPKSSNIMNMHGMRKGNGMHMGMMGDQTDITNLEKAADFDKEFLEHMIPHHQMAVMMALMLKNGTDRPEMKQLADDIITSQTSEIEQMRIWLNKWY